MNTSTKLNPIQRLLERLFPPARPIETGVYHYQAPPDAPIPYRLHLRIEGDGRGILIINASTVLHLNQTAAEYAFHFIKKTPPEEVARLISKRYKVSSDQAKSDFNGLQEQINQLIHQPDLDPETFLGDERQSPYTVELCAPYRLDCALTYRLDEESGPETAPTERAKRELETFEWKAILDKAWNAGIPHVVFTGGEPTLRADLPALIQHSEHLGQVTGLITNGLRLANPDYLNSLLQSGLDHLMMILQPDKPLFWEALQAVLAADIHVTVHLTLIQDNISEINSVLDRLAGLGVKSISISAARQDQQELLTQARNSVASRHLALVWDLPVPYSSLHPVALELAGEVAPSGAGHDWLYVEPDGDVLPSQGILAVMGSLLTEPWEKIWRCCCGEEKP